jgi:hypothetical protein
MPAADTAIAAAANATLTRLCKPISVDSHTGPCRPCPQTMEPYRHLACPRARHPRFVRMPINQDASRHPDSGNDIGMVPKRIGHGNPKVRGRESAACPLSAQPGTPAVHPERVAYYPAQGNALGYGPTPSLGVVVLSFSAPTGRDSWSCRWIVSPLTGLQLRELSTRGGATRRGVARASSLCPGLDRISALRACIRAITRKKRARPDPGCPPTGDPQSKSG